MAKRVAYDTLNVLSNSRLRLFCSLRLYTAIYHMSGRKMILMAACLLLSSATFAQKKTGSKAKPKAKKTVAAAPAAPAKVPVCFPLKEVKDMYRLDMKNEKFKDEYREAFEAAKYSYTGYSIKSIIERRVRKQAGDNAANALDLFADNTSLEITITRPEMKKEILDIICNTFTDADAFEKELVRMREE
jgi:hypothetical protein